MNTPRKHAVLAAFFSLVLVGCIGDPPVPCTSCGDVCADLQNDSRHCGMCDRACAVGQTCRAGVCGCGTGQQLCGSACTNPLTDSANCGTCGNACPQGLTCSNGSCNCATGQTACGGRCSDLSSDRNNCGACGNACRAPEFCVSGACRVTCPSPLNVCGDNCINFSNDRNNCGSCGRACLPGQNCVGGACECPPGQTQCGNGCFDTSTSLDHCGACGRACAPANATPTCLAGSCNYTSCDAGFSDCDGDRRNGCERNTATDIANCGACGNVCRPVNVATATAALDASIVLPDAGLGVSACQAAGGIPCYSSRLPDGGSGVALRPDYPVGVACVASSCGYDQCIPGFLDCDRFRPNGCEVNGQDDVQNCGSCGVRCGAGQSCLRGSCQTCRRTALLLVDGLDLASTPALESALRAAGFTTTLTNPTTYGGSPAASSFGAVVISPGASFGTDIPAAGQTSIATAIGPNTGLVMTEWVAFQLTQGRYTGLRQLVAFTRTSSTSSATYSLVVPFHPLWDGLPATFAGGASSSVNVGSLVPDGGIIIGRCDVCGGPGVAVLPGTRNRVVQLAHAAGFNGTWYSDPNMLKMMVNAVEWAAGCK